MHAMRPDRLLPFTAVDAPTPVQLLLVGYQKGGGGGGYQGGCLVHAVRDESSDACDHPDQREDAVECVVHKRWHLNDEVQQRRGAPTRAMAAPSLK